VMYLTLQALLKESWQNMAIRKGKDWYVFYYICFCDLNPFIAFLTHVGS